MRLDGKTAIVTGAGSGLGKATAQLFGREGARLGLLDISQRRPKAWPPRSTPPSSVRLRLPVGRMCQRKTSLRPPCPRLRENLGPINILVNNAGIAQIKDFLDISSVEWQRMLDVHVKGTFLCTQAVIEDMVNTGWGRVINTASVAGMEGGPQNAHYAAAKAAIIGLTRSLALSSPVPGLPSMQLPRA